ncbi:hypothetical protein DL93DRAFT_2088682 [Clavulina sp. PMI_390]|nr:hypothetical protein DL93DRAFT_2088682 [Clavulina sp. PMI_390]
MDTDTLILEIADPPIPCALGPWASNQTHYTCHCHWTITSASLSKLFPKGGPSSRDSPTQATTSLPSSYNRDGKQKTEEEQEAEYWATYSSVQGTADSTIPSRVPSTRKFASFVPHDELDQLGLDPLSMREQWMGEQAGDGDGYGYDYNEEYDRPMSYAVGRASEGAFASSSGAVPEPSLWAPSASTALPTSSSSNDARDVDSRVLRRLSPPQERQEWQVPEADERDATNASALAKALVPVIAYQDHLEEVERSRSATASAEGSVKSSGDIDMDTEVVTDSPAPKADVLPPSSSKALVCKESLTAADTAVISSVRGLYALWQAQRSSASKEETNSSDRDAFMELVRQAVDTQ